MENGTSTQSAETSSYPFKWLLPIIAALGIGIAAYWFYFRETTPEETRFAFAIDHYFNDPKVFFGGKGLRYEIVRSDTRMLRLTLPEQSLEPPKYLLVEDGELDYLGFVKAGQLFIPLELYQIHNLRPGAQEGPVSDCKTYIEVNATTDTILVMVDDQYLLRGKKVGKGMYVIPFCETSRNHTFRLVGRQQDVAAKNLAPATFSIGGSSGQMAIADNSKGRLRYSGDTIRNALTPAMYSNTGKPGVSLMQKTEEIRYTRVTVALPRRLESPWVYLNDKRLRDFNLNSSGSRITFTIPQSNKPVTVRAGDRNCECTASGYPLHSSLELAAYCDCRDYQVTVNLDPGLDRYRNKIRIYINGQLSDLDIPPMGQPFTFPVRKTGQDQQVALKLLLVDDTGRSGLIDVCNFSVPAEATTVNLNPECHCAECPPNIKVSG
ncbi:MAG: hypothetical protein L6Q97_05070 [Thermoanaerobaculia bacterium]|nr:hypothetical protein [Thermoanaerobaculia bacterium]